VCNPNRRDAIELFNDVERNESRGSILDIYSSVGTDKMCSNFRAEATLAIRTRGK
jgi:hypothetical protein